MGSNCYCCLCGGPLYEQHPGRYVDEDELKGDDDERCLGYDPKLVTQEDLEWTGKIRLIGHRDEAAFESESQYFLTGSTGNFGGKTAFLVERGADPNFPTLMPTRDGVRYALTAYGLQEKDQPAALPFHEACFQYVLIPAIKDLDPECKTVDLKDYKVDLGTLWRALESFLFDLAMCLGILNLDYGAIVRCHSRDWWIGDRGDEAWVSYPGSSSELDRFYHSMLKASTQRR